MGSSNYGPPGTRGTTVPRPGLSPMPPAPGQAPVPGPGRRRLGNARLDARLPRNRQMITAAVAPPEWLGDDEVTTRGTPRRESHHVLGEPLALIVLGLLLMGVGFLTFRLKRMAES